jgi:PBSX family phage terminase large subunit
MISQESKSEVRLTQAIAPSFYDIHWDIQDGEHTHYWFAGGRGSTKSSFIAVELILGIMADPSANAIVLRKVKDTIKGSVDEQLEWAIDILGVEDYWHKSLSPIGFTYKPTGQSIRFKGADKPKKIKGSKYAKGYCKFIWYEELDEFNGMEEIRMINQSLMRGGKKFTVFYSYNPPKSANSWVNTEIRLTRDDRLTHHSTYLTVPKEWLGDQFIVEAEHLKATKPTSYEHEYLGNVTGTGGEVFDNVQIRKISNEEIADFYNIRRGLDYGYAIDPVSYNVMHYDRKYKRLYIFFEIYKVGMSNYMLNQEIEKENKDNEQIIAESAEPKSNHELRQYGRKIRAVKKGPDSIEYGIKFLQSLEAIIIDDHRCPETAREFLTYELDKDVNGNFKAGYPDKNNHSIDATRYALNDEAMQFKERKKTESDPDEPTPQEKQQKAIKAITGGKPNTAVYTKW